MTDTKRDVDFTVNVGDARITEAGFGVEAILAAHIKSKARVLAFADQDEVLTVFSATDPVAKASNAAFSQKGEAGRLSLFKVLRQLVDKVVVDLPSANVTDRGDIVTVTVTQADVDSTYIVDITGATSSVSVTADSNSTAATIATALVALINGLATSPVTAADLGAGVFTLTADVADTSFSLSLLTQTSVGAITGPADIDTPRFTATGGYSIELNDVIHCLTSIAASTAITVADAMAVLIALAGTTNSLGYTASGNGDGTLDITITPATVDYLALVEGADFDVVLDTGDATTTELLSRKALFYHVRSGSETVSEALAAATAEDKDYYGVGSLYVADADIIALATAIAPLAKIHGYSTQSSDAKDATKTTDPMSVLKSSAFNRSFGTSRADASTFFEFAQMGDRLPTNPGSSTWKFKELVGQPLEVMTSAEEAAVLGKNGNVYTDLGGSGATAEGQMASGRFIDDQRSVDYMEARTDEAFIAALKAAPKIGVSEYQIVFGGILDGLYNLGGKFNTEGITTQLDDPVNQEFYRRTIPTPAQRSASDKATRTVSSIIVETQRDSPIHKITGIINVRI